MTTTHINDALAAIRARDPRVPDVALILGSGLGDLADGFADPVAIPFPDIPGFPHAAVAGHRGRLVIGRLEDVTCVALQGRFHLYEGYDAATVTLPTRVMLGLGARTLIVTNAAGGINRTFQPGDLMLIDDHVNLMGRNPLTGPVQEGDTRFPDMTHAYDPALQALAESVAGTEGIRLVRGVYAAVLGPSYETPAEVRMIERLGGDVVGMSTVPEVIVARARDVPVLGISLVTNAAAGLSAEPLTHDEVVAAGREAADRFARLVRGVVRGLGNHDA
ncbi:MAG TPA: purine-nucleoside phosphorylase [Longimicrobiales bacterium]|nr:purine-nucleoside phosphorylase [Longimicrobiales bacterium]